jgi:dTDP-4-dehydrorhamnose reductase
LTNALCNSVVPELWGGLECTVNRIGDNFCDQIVRSGHQDRADDLEQIAALGIRTLRYPVLWERTQPNAQQKHNWQWTDERMDELQRLGMRPIVGLVHHGSGPPEVNLLDDRFASALSAYALQVAQRYPWIEDYTPVNEPLTTARFSALYGHWYPHRRDPQAFLKAIVVQCRATVLAMQAIRQVNPFARLVQTEDFGITYSTSSLRYQADFENERRWLTWDLLCGRVDRDHPMWHYARYVGISDAELGWFLDHPCPPDVIGINQYVTSARFLDERLERYPPWTHGGNGQQAYADVEAVRVLEPAPPGIGEAIRAAWERYHLPVAVTECHLGCTPDEQMRWLWETWQAAQQAHRQGADVRAVTVWAMFGAYDWNSLLTRDSGHYEPGVFALNTSTGQPQPTPLAELVQALATGSPSVPEIVHSAGWWKRPERLIYPPVCRESGKDRTQEHRTRKPVSAGSGRRSVKNTLG